MLSNHRMQQKDSENGPAPCSIVSVGCGAMSGSEKRRVAESPGPVPIVRARSGPHAGSRSFTKPSSVRTSSLFTHLQNALVEDYTRLAAEAEELFLLLDLSDCLQMRI